MDEVVAVLALLVAIALLWTGKRRLVWEGPLAALLSALDLLALVLLVVTLGWLGLGLLLVANLVAFVGWGMAGAIYVDQQTADASALGVIERDEVKRLLANFDRERDLHILGPRRRARLVRLLAKRARSAAEIEQMALPLGMLWVICDKPNLDWLVERFDTLLRLYGQRAAEAMATADVLTAGAQQAAATLEEMLEASVVAAGGSPSLTPEALAPAA